MPTSTPPTRRSGQAAPVSVDMQAINPIAYTPRHLAERILAEQAALEARGAADGERRITRPHRMILMRQWCPEQGHDAIAMT